ncbi:MAG: methyltransferase domain-containing protein [Cyanobacteria bacterium K_DeepCast_35m_m2_155]|nr:methyltransferase domain-containing protein [Cyanobacteria bacterium K_DeepCast_35m_m2_155]
MSAAQAETLQQSVRQYYGSTLSGSADLRTSACCDATTVPPALKPLLARIHPEVSARYYGCGLVAPPVLEGARVLDLGCGSGRDVYLLAQLVGPAGQVVGVDMTPEQLAVALQHQGWHAEQFGYANVRFLEGLIEQLDQLDLEPASFDVVVSNCVVNLATDKGAVLAGVRRLLKPGGEFYFADVYADRRIDPALRDDPVLYGECLSGALYWNDFLRVARQSGFADPRLVSSRPLSISDPALVARLGATRFFSATYRLFNIAELEDACEDHGQTVRYLGNAAGNPEAFDLDDHHHFETGRSVPVCGNTFRMLRQSRFADHFAFDGDFARHFGLFAGCGGGLPFSLESNGSCC